eukprot:4693794-Prymnesium_polylepis.1
MWRRATAATDSGFRAKHAAPRPTYVDIMTSLSATLDASDLPEWRPLPPPELRPLGPLGRLGHRSTAAGGGSAERVGSSIGAARFRWPSTTLVLSRDAATPSPRWCGRAVLTAGAVRVRAISPMPLAGGERAGGGGSAACSAGVVMGARARWISASVRSAPWGGVVAAIARAAACGAASGMPMDSDIGHCYRSPM